MSRVSTTTHASDKVKLLSKATELAKHGKGSGGPPHDAVGDLLHAYYRHVPPEDLVDRSDVGRDGRGLLLAQRVERLVHAALQLTSCVGGRTAVPDEDQHRRSVNHTPRVGRVAASNVSWPVRHA